MNKWKCLFGAFLTLAISSGSTSYAAGPINNKQSINTDKRESSVGIHQTSYPDSYTLCDYALTPKEGNRIVVIGL